MPRLVNYPKPMGSLIKEKVGKGGKWNWRTNLGDAAEMLLPSTPQESLTAGIMNVGMAGMIPQYEGHLLKQADVIGAKHGKKLGKGSKLSVGELADYLNVGDISEEEAIEAYGKDKVNEAIATYMTKAERNLGIEPIEFFKSKKRRGSVMTAKPGPKPKAKISGLKQAEEMGAFDTEGVSLDEPITSFNFADREHELSDYIADHWFSKPEQNAWRSDPIRQDVVKEGRRAKWAGKLHESQVGPNGEHLTRYHGTKKSFDEFWSIEDRPIMSNVGSFDQLLGPHFAADPAVGESFALTAGSPAGSGKPGGRVIPVKLRISNPKVVWQPQLPYEFNPAATNSPLMWDQTAVALDMWETVGSYSPQWFREWININSRNKRFSVDKDIANEIYAHFKAGKEVPKDLIKEAGYETRGKEWYKKLMQGNPKDPYMASLSKNPWTDTGFSGSIQEFIRLHDFHSFETPMEPNLKRNLLRTYQRVLKSEGYDAVQYMNTSETETKWAKDYRTWIVFDKDQIKGVFGRFTPGDPDFLKGVAITGVGIEAEERANRRTR